MITDDQMRDHKCIRFRSQAPYYSQIEEDLQEFDSVARFVTNTVYAPIPDITVEEGNQIRRLQFAGI
jgi:hypothetical protein